MKRMQYSIEVTGVIFATREQAEAVVKNLKSALAGIDAKGGITKVEVELTAVRKAPAKRKPKLDSGFRRNDGSVGGGDKPANLELDEKPN